MPEMKTLNGYEVVDAKARHDIDLIKPAVIDLYNCTKVTDTYWQFTDNVKNILQRLFNGETFPLVIATNSASQYVPSTISVTSDKIRITLDTKHGYVDGNPPKLLSLYTDTYVFTKAEGYLQITTNTIDVVDSNELQALEERISALENIPIAEEGSY